MKLPDAGDDETDDDTTKDTEGVCFFQSACKLVY